MPQIKLAKFVDYRNINRKRLTDEKEDFILANHKKMTPLAIADHIDVSYSCVYSFIVRNELSVKLGKRIKAETKANSGFFNVESYAKQTSTI